MKITCFKFIIVQPAANTLKLRIYRLNIESDIINREILKKFTSKGVFCGLCVKICSDYSLEIENNKAVQKYIFHNLIPTSAPVPS